MPYQLGPPPMNPVSRLLAGLSGLLVLAGAFFFGLFVLAIAVGLGAIVAVLLWLRIWWIRKRMSAAGWRTEERMRGREGRPGEKSRRRGDVIDAEYEILSRRRDG